MNAPDTMPHGLFAGVPAAEYHRRTLGEVSKSGLDRLARSPAHYRAWVLGAEQSDTPAMAFGRAYHAAILEPDVYRTRLLVRPSFGDPRTKAAREARDAWLAAHPDAETIDAEDSDRIEAMREALMRHEIAANLVIGGTPELTVRWRDGATGLPCKARADFYMPELAVAFDLKTTSDASDSAFAKSCAAYRYHVQAAFYQSGFAAVGAPIEHFFFVAQETKAPYGVNVYYLDDAAIERAEQLIARDLRVLRQCVDTDTWPAYSNHIKALALPAWAFYD